MTATAALPFNTNAGRIPQADAGKPAAKTQGAVEGGQDSFATVLAGTAQASQPSQAGAAPAAASATTQLSKLVAAETGDSEAIPVESNAEGVAADTSQLVPAVAVQPTAVAATTLVAPNLAGTALVADAEAGDAAAPAGESAEGAEVAPSAASAGVAAAGVVASAAAGAATGQPTAAATATTAATVDTTAIDASAAVETAAGEGSEVAIDGEGDATTASANSQTPSKASASTTVASPAGTANPNAATTAAAPDLQAAVADPAGQAKPAATVDALAASAPAPHEAARASATHTAAQAAVPAATMQVYTRMIERFDGRAQRFEIRLDPAELGRVDVRIEIGADKKVHAVLAAHDSAALNDLMRGHRALERALADAGIDLADGGVKFELASDSNRNSSTGNGESRSPTAPNVWRSFELTNPSAEAAVKPVAQPWRQSRLDLVA